MCRVHLGKMGVGAMEAFCSTVLGSISRRCTALTPALLSFEWHHLFNRSAPFPQKLRRHRKIISTKQTSSLLTVERTELSLYSSSLPVAGGNETDTAVRTQHAFFIFMFSKEHVGGSLEEPCSHVPGSCSSIKGSFVSGPEISLAMRPAWR